MRISRRLAWILVAAVGVGFGGARASAEEVSLEGEVVDLACFITRGDKGRGPGHQECAEMCAEGGQPLGLLVEGGDVLLLVEDHAKPAPYASVKNLAGKDAAVTGEKLSRGGITALVVRSAKPK